jgi:hypothetical protein
MNLTLDDRTRIFDKVCRLLATKHVDPGMNGMDWDSLARATPVFAMQECATFPRITPPTRLYTRSE